MTGGRPVAADDRLRRVSGVPGIDEGPVTAWLAERQPELRPPLTFELIAGGHSNLTYSVRDAEGHRYVLRRPPLGHVLPTAHDMAREHRIISALSGSSVPVPPAVGLCTDESVNGAPFFVMRFVDGEVVRDLAAAERVLPLPARAAAGRELASVLARLHATDPDQVGLGELGRRDGYLARQLDRWYGQWRRSKDRELPLIDEVYRRLAAEVPPQRGAGIVHGDYRLDNCILGPDGAVRAVLDWELCTLGDVLADLGITLVYWAEPGDTSPSSLGRPTAAPGFPSREEFLTTYAQASGRDVSGIDYYRAFGYWKLACILQGVYVRYVAGAMGQVGAVAEMPRQIDSLAEAAAAMLH
jgi:aminoglycoside phosphotransferase (APT) family kinase protein